MCENNDMSRTQAGDGEKVKGMFWWLEEYHPPVEKSQVEELAAAETRKAWDKLLEEAFKDNGAVLEPIWIGEDLEQRFEGFRRKHRKEII